MTKLDPRAGASSMRRGHLMLLVCGAFLGASVFALLRPGRALPLLVSTPASTATAEGPRADTALQRLESRVAQLEQQPRPSPELARQATEPKAEPAHPDLEPGLTDTTAETREIARLDGAWSQERRDANWAKDAEHGVVAALSGQAFAGNRLTSVECRSTLCRMQLSHDSASARAVFEEQFPAQAPANQGGFAQRLGDEQQGYATLLFLARPGSTTLMGEQP